MRWRWLINYERLCKAKENMWTEQKYFQYAAAAAALWQRQKPDSSSPVNSTKHTHKHSPPALLPEQDVSHILMCFKPPSTWIKTGITVARQGANQPTVPPVPLRENTVTLNIELFRYSPLPWLQPDHLCAPCTGPASGLLCSGSD